jgi:ParB/Sulfiredoxin domain
MTSIQSTKGAAAETANALQNCPAGKSDNQLDNTNPDQVIAATATTKPTHKWHSKYKVHPAADVFPMMPDEELKKLGEDIKANGLKHPIVFFSTTTSVDDLVLIDGRNRLEAMERAGLDLPDKCKWLVTGDDPVPLIISLNVHRRHLTKQQQADLIVAAYTAGADKPRKLCEVSKGGRGKVDEVKANILATAKEQKIGRRTVELAIAKARGGFPKPKPRPAPPKAQKVYGSPLKAKPKLEAHTGIDAARKYYLEQFIKLDASARDAELETLMTEIKEAVGKSLMQANGSSRGDDDLGDIPEFLDRRRRP